MPALTPSLLLARAKRAKQLVVHAEISSIEVLIILLEKALHYRQALLLSINPENLMLPDDILRDVIVQILKEYDLPYSLLLRSEEMSQNKSAWSIQGLEVDATNKNLAQIPLHDQEIILNFSEQLDVLPSEVLQNSGALAAVIHCIRCRQNPGELLQSVSDLNKSTSMPIIVDIAGMSGYYIKRLPKLGIIAISLGELLDEAYTAGIRAALRNRELNDPGVYQSKGIKAVEGSLDYLFNLLPIKKTD